MTCAMRHATRKSGKTAPIANLGPSGRLRISRSPLFATPVFLFLGLFVLLFVAPLQAQNGATAPQKLNPYTGKAEAITEGQQLYKKFNCYGCHGMQGGGGMGPNLTDETWQTGDGSDLNILQQIREGKGTMPPFKTMLNDDQAWKLIAFVRSLYKGDPKKANW